ncbi:hypothetical protein PCASD_25223 [Puccinia coronata f. sp. avenae]|uniref:Uncharacterized protein n=1 Tax=Puccinia coronata f. sp. avenae TaxID=200324 RepID=A0A2N5TLT3_9BASI|nr:hypothetical protein PCASD_25223 [Puccinia coronata f. sp. avenae]
MPKHLRTTKFDSVSWDGIVIGYSNDYLAYKVIRLPNKSIIETKHASFDESVFLTLGALNPSEEDDLNTFQDEDCVPAEQEEERMVLDDDEGREQEKPLEDQAEDPVDTQEDSPPAPPPQQLIIHGLDTPLLSTAPLTRAISFAIPVVLHNNKDEWVKAEQREIDNMLDHNVWNEVPAHPDVVTIPSTWAYKKKLGSNNEVVKFKARICAQGFCQTHGLSFDLKYAPTGKPSSL